MWDTGEDNKTNSSMIPHAEEVKEMEKSIKMGNGRNMRNLSHHNLKQQRQNGISIDTDKLNMKQ